MKLRWLIPISLLIPLQAAASLSGDTSGRVITLTLQQDSITTLHLRPEFESIIHLPEEVTSVVVGSPGSFKVEHSEGEPEYVYVKPLARTPSQSDLLIATKSGRHIVLELVSDGATSSAQPVDFLIEYHAPRSFLIAAGSAPEAVHAASAEAASTSQPGHSPKGLSAIDEEFELQKLVNAPDWRSWEGQQIKTSVGDIRQWSNQTAISYSIFNASDKPVEIVPPQIQITGEPADKKKKKKKKGILADQLEISEYRLSATRLEPGGRADGVVVFDRPNFKQSTEKLFLQIAQADQVDKPILVQLPFTPPISLNGR
ncbi:hypothetical protein [Granulicella sp. L60]|uniref:hypothetical protein n=1 Tax=Granulicella sp. L60 TaxID=1641866 RepID=UPI00131E8E77|nr:hypothetical protein [Granulicella sp. L60]